MIKYNLIRKKRKSLTIKIELNGEVIVLAPQRFSIDRINDFVLAKADWIEKNIDKSKKKYNLIKPYLNLEKLKVFGHDYNIKLCQNDTVKIIDNDIYLKDISVAEIKKFIYETTYNYIESRVSILANKVGVIFKSFKLDNAKTRLGQCSSLKKLSFNYKLSMFDKGYIDYIIIHELCHLKHMNHSKEFWVEVSKHVDNLKEIKSKIKDQTYLISIF